MLRKKKPKITGIMTAKITQFINPNTNKAYKWKVKYYVDKKFYDEEEYYNIHNLISDFNDADLVTKVGQEFINKRLSWKTVIEKEKKGMKELIELIENFKDISKIGDIIWEELDNSDQITNEDAVDALVQHTSNLIKNMNAIEKKENIKLTKEKNIVKKLNKLASLWLELEEDKFQDKYSERDITDLTVEIEDMYKKVKNKLIKK